MHDLIEIAKSRIFHTIAPIENLQLFRPPNRKNGGVWLQPNHLLYVYSLDDFDDVPFFFVLLFYYFIYFNFYLFIYLFIYLFLFVYYFIYCFFIFSLFYLLFIYF